MCHWMVLLCILILLLSSTSAEIFDSATNNISYTTITCTENDCNVVCDTSNGCQGATIHSNQSDTLTLTCSNTKACEDLEIISAAQISTHIYCTGINACEYSIFNVGNSALIDINCNATSDSIFDGACSHSDVNATESTTLNIECYGEWSCYKMDVHCPLSANGQCNFDCESTDSINSCSHMAIYCPYVDNIDIECGFDRSACWQTDVYCGTDTSAPHSMLQQLSDEAGFGCTAGENDQCCPFLNGTINCDSNTGIDSCLIDCTATNCVNRIIDASNAGTTLTVNCAVANGFRGCGGAIIKCANGAKCDIQCPDDESCSAVTIRAMEAHTLSVTCLDSFSCRTTNFYAMFAENVIIYAEGLFSLNHGNIYAHYVDTLHVSCHGIDLMEPCYDVTIYSYYAKSVTLNATENDGFDYSILYAQHADSVTINCISGMGEYACHASDFYIPDYGRNTTLNCYGHGCWEMGDIYVNHSISLLDLNVNACGQCDSLLDCTRESFIINCEPLNSYAYDHSLPLSNCSVSTHCGCNVFTDEVSFRDDESDSMCILAPTPTPTQAPVPTRAPIPTITVVNMGLMCGCCMSWIAVVALLFL